MATVAIRSSRSIRKRDEHRGSLDSDRSSPNRDPWRVVQVIVEEESPLSLTCRVEYGIKIDGRSSVLVSTDLVRSACLPVVVGSVHILRRSACVDQIQ